MPGLSLKKQNRETAKKEKKQRKQEKRDERRQAATADKAITGTSANGIDLAVENP